MKQLSMIAFMLVTLSLAGCVKVMIPETNSIAGTVVDEGSMIPIEGVTIYYSDYPEKKVLTGSDGRFELLATFNEKWSLPLPADHHPAEQNVTVLGIDGYETKTIVGESKFPMIIKLDRANGEESIFTKKSAE